MFLGAPVHYCDILLFHATKSSIYTPTKSTETVESVQRHSWVVCFLVWSQLGVWGDGAGYVSCNLHLQRCRLFHSKCLCVVVSLLSASNTQAELNLKHGGRCLLRPAKADHSGQTGLFFEAALKQAQERVTRGAAAIDSMRKMMCCLNRRACSVHPK